VLGVSLVWWAFGWVLFGFSAPLSQHIQWALDAGDHAGGDAGIACRGIELFVPQERLDQPDIPAALKKMGGEAVAQCM
jgi:hypothetical protein